MKKEGVTVVCILLLVLLSEICILILLPNTKNDCIKLVSTEFNFIAAVLVQSFVLDV